MYKGFLIDLDGTAYIGNEKVESCVRFVNKLVEYKIDFLFVTNNSSATKNQLATRLISMGYNISEKNIYSSAIATATYIKINYPNKKVLTIGSDGLDEALINEGIECVKENADIVVCGYNTMLKYEDIANACLEINNGALFISTNPDNAIPTERGFIPENGATTKMIEYATGITALSIGKPNAIIAEYAINLLGLQKQDVAMIGDNYNTDILCGFNSNIDTIHVETGISTKEEVMLKTPLPTHMVKNLDEFQLIMFNDEI